MRLPCEMCAGARLGRQAACAVADAPCVGCLLRLRYAAGGRPERMAELFTFFRIKEQRFTLPNRYLHHRDGELPSAS